MAKGDLRRNKLHIPRPAASGRSRPFRCSSFSRTNRFAGFAREPLLWNPLKTTKKRADAPFLDHSRSLVCAKVDYKSTKRDADVYPVVRRGSRNTLRYGRADRGVRPYTGNAGRCGHRPLRTSKYRKVSRISHVKYSTGANLATRVV